jgi:hypothetical protein
MRREPLQVPGALSRVPVASLDDGLGVFTALISVGNLVLEHETADVNAYY